MQELDDQTKNGWIFDDHLKIGAKNKGNKF